MLHLLFSSKVLILTIAIFSIISLLSISARWLEQPPKKQKDIEYKEKEHRA